MSNPEDDERGTGPGRRGTGARLKPRTRAPRADKPLDLDDPATRGRVFESVVVEEWVPELKAKGFTEFYAQKAVDGPRKGRLPLGTSPIPAWLKAALKGAKPDLVAIRPPEGQASGTVLFGDVTANPGTQASPRQGDPRAVPTFEGPKPTIHHLEKTIEDAERGAAGLPAHLKGYDVVAQDRYSESDAIESRQVTVFRNGKFTRPSAIRANRPPPAPPAAPPPTPPPASRPPPQPLWEGARRKPSGLIGRLTGALTKDKGIARRLASSGMRRARRGSFEGLRQVVRALRAALGSSRSGRFAKFAKKAGSIADLGVSVSDFLPDLDDILLTIESATVWADLTTTLESLLNHLDELSSSKPKEWPPLHLELTHEGVLQAMQGLAHLSCSSFELDMRIVIQDFEDERDVLILGRPEVWAARYTGQQVTLTRPENALLDCLSDLYRMRAIVRNHRDLFCND